MLDAHFVTQSEPASSQSRNSLVPERMVKNPTTMIQSTKQSVRIIVGKPNMIVLALSTNSEPRIDRFRYTDQNKLQRTD